MVNVIVLASMADNFFANSRLLQLLLQVTLIFWGNNNMFLQVGQDGNMHTSASTISEYINVDGCFCVRF